MLRTRIIRGSIFIAIHLCFLSQPVLAQQEIIDPDLLIRDLKKFNHILEDVQYSKVGQYVVARGIVTQPEQKKLYNSIKERYDIIDLVADRVRPWLVTIQAQIYEVNVISGDSYHGLNNEMSFRGSIFKSDGVALETEDGYSRAEGEGYSLDASLKVPLLEKLMFLRTQGEAKLVSSPVITVTDTKEASILSGGEIPYPEISETGARSTTWKEYGNSIKITPTMLDKDTNGIQYIYLDLETEVSTIDRTSASEIPSLLTRKATSQVTVPANKTLIISGIIYEEESIGHSKVPILGTLLPFMFRDYAKQRITKELVILVKITPNLGEADHSEYLINDFPPQPPIEFKK